MAEIRPLTSADRSALLAFVDAIPVADHWFLRDDPTDPDLIEDWLAGTGERRLVAIEDDGRIVAMAAVVQGLGTGDHVGELRIIVLPESRGIGMGRAIAQRIVLEAFAMELAVIYVSVVARQEALVDMFRAMGFRPEALLEDFVRDDEGAFHDLMLLTHRVENEQSSFAALGIDEDVLG
jgi:L-amino acid N-acyltransferase YncA